MGQHSIFVIGGEDDETISLSDEFVHDLCRLVCVVRGETHHADEADFFEALRKIRKRVLEPIGLIPFCYGASLKVWPSAMSRDMGRGLKAYKIELGAPTTEIAGIFEEGPDVVPATVQRQEEFARAWFASLRN